MTRRPVMVLMVLASMLMAGCLGYFENQEEEQNFDWITPELLLGNRMRSSPALNHYDGCAELEEDLRNSMIEEMMVGLDQASYWHWNSWGFRGGMMVDDMVMEMDGDMAMPETTGSDSSNSMDSSSPPSTSGAGDREGQYSETNNQEEGVDEADFLKTDGYHIYMINNGQLVILGVPEFGNITLESNMTLEGSPMQMLVSGDQLVIISSVSYWDLEIDDPVRIAMMVDNSEDEREYSYYRYSNKVKYSVLNITNRSDPQIDRELYIDGSYQTSRLVDGTLRAVTHSYAQLQGLQTYPDLPESYWEIDYDDPERQDIWNESVDEAVAYNIGVISALTLADFSPRMHERMADGTVAELSTVSATCEEFSAAADSVGRGFTTIMTIELFGDIIEYELDHVSSSWVEVYASQDMLILAEPANDWWWYWRNDAFEEATNIHAFDISDGGLTTYIGSGRVTGTVNDQFSLSEYNGTIRVATTQDVWGRWWLEDGDNWTGPTNDVYVLAPAECMIPEGCDDQTPELMQIGHVGGIAEGETIWSCRFIGEKGYLVTFRNMDPLWTIDLSNPTNPQVIGELEVPGVSTYIHPLSDDHLLTIGIAGGEDGLGLDWGNTQISLFDVSNFADPTLASALQLAPVDRNSQDWWSWAWSYSEATYEHKAFTYWAPAELLAIPLSTYRYTYDEVTIDGRKYSYSGYEYVSQLVLVKVDPENNTLIKYGTIDHSDFYNGDSGLREHYYSGSPNVRRSIFMGDYIYAFSAEGVTVTNYTSMNLSASIDLPEQINIPNYWDDVVYAESDDVREDSDDGDGDGAGSSSGSSEESDPDRD
ncbi:MAG TPA: beta-propeller domain-containing protein [Candidatus Thalassarchaeaceae archaeon]|nr:beta-propeller domain-containing protein [Candidatus Thalassarchaeaceae archaeon]